MQRLGRRATYVKLSGNVSNALDFHIAFYLGVLAVRDSAAYFHIISKDTGYDPLIQRLRARDIKAHRFEMSAPSPSYRKLFLLRCRPRRRLNLVVFLPPVRRLYLRRSLNRTGISRRYGAGNRRACDQWRRSTP